ITAVSPATITTGQIDIKVTTSGGTSAPVNGDHFSYSATTPTVTAVSPNNGPTGGGTNVTITGTQFITGSTVAFGTGNPATNVVIVNSTTITATSPARTSAATVDIRVTNSAGTSAVNAPGDQFTYNAVTPAVTAVSPTGGPIAGGTAVTITGTNFITGATVSFGGTAGTAVTVVSAT